MSRISLSLRKEYIERLRELSLEVFDSSNAVLGMAFTLPPLEKVIAFCTAETNIVLNSKQNKNKDRIKSS